MKDLSIIIPTYNRLGKLSQNIKSLYSQIDERVCIKVIDNASTDFWVFKNECTEIYPKVQIIENKHNVGLGGNILKCFENAETKWLWVLADDDIVKPNTISVVLGIIDKWSDASYINMNSDIVSRTSNLEVKGANAFINQLDSFANLLFVSVGLYNLSKVGNSIRFGYMYNHTIAPHLAILLSSLTNNSYCYFLEFQPIIRTDVTYDLKEKWSTIPLQTSLMSLLEIPMDISDTSFNSLAKHLETHIKTPQSNFKNLLFYPEFINKKKQLIYIYAQMFLRTKFLKYNFTNALFYYIFLFVFKFNIHSLIRNILLKKNMYKSINLTRFGRI
jgi:glycosyltransferase involved in cell wall biosynthesis